MSGSTWDGDSQYIKGDDGSEDGVKIGAVGDALKTIGITSVTPIPEAAVDYKDIRMTDSGGSPSMDVNASSADKDFFYAPPSGEVWYVEKVAMFINDGGTNDPNDFGAITDGLSEGLQLVIKRGGIESIETNLQDNIDIVLCFVGVGQPTSSGFLNSADAFYGVMSFDTPLELNGDNGDFIAFRVRDKLTKLTNLRSSVRVWRGL